MKFLKFIQQVLTLQEVRDALEKEFELAQAELTMVPSMFVPLDDDAKKHF